MKYLELINISSFILFSFFILVFIVTKCKIDNIESKIRIKKHKEHMEMLNNYNIEMDRKTKEILNNYKQINSIHFKN